MVKNTKIKSYKRLFALLLFANFLSACTTLHQQIGKEYSSALQTPPKDSIQHQFVLIGDAGNANEAESMQLLSQIENSFPTYTNASTLLVLGDNIYQKGMPPKEHKNRADAESKLKVQTDLAKAFPGKSYFIAGNHDWYSGLDGLIEQKEMVDKAVGKNTFLPKAYEAIKEVKLTDDIQLILIDSEWFLQDWNLYSNINRESEIQSREDFFEELRSTLNKGQNKLTILAMHHPLLTNGVHGGYFSVRGHLAPIKKVPLPGLGTVINYLMKTSGASPADTQNITYRNLINRISTMVKDYENVLIVSGHDHNLQYIDSDGVKQIISGSASKTEPAKARQPKSFSIGELGYGVLTTYGNGDVWLRFDAMKNNALETVFEQPIIQKENSTYQYSTSFPTEIKASVYDQKETEKSKWYQFLWGEHYRPIYGTEITAKVAQLDTLYGGLTPIISGGGKQSLSLRLQDKSGKQYVMRGLRKSSTRFLQAGLIRDKYIKNDLKGTGVLPFIDDYYTTSHPYLPFVIGHLADAVDVYHTNPKLFYVPKQNALGQYNKWYGDELYMIEERPHKSFLDADNFGNPEDIVSTEEVIFNLEKDEKYSIDRERYLRARIFDLLIGDWDRHADQWRWGKHTVGEKVVYEPLPRDRDQVFAKIDGNLLSLIKKLPSMRHMQNFSSDFANPRWINKSAFPMDRYFLQTISKEDWQRVAQEVVEGINEEKVKETFALLPKEIQSMNENEIIEILLERRAKLVEFVGDYYDELLKYGLIVGTNKRDKFVVNTSKNQIRVDEIRIKKTGEEWQRQYTYDPSITKEIWIYGLDNQDEFIVEGEKTSTILRLIGGRNHDQFRVESPTKTRIYDYKSNKISVEKGPSTRLISKDNYELNNFDYRRAPISILQTLPSGGYNKDNGILLGMDMKWTKQNFIYDPFAQQHTLKAKVAFETSSLQVDYAARFKNYSRNWHWALETGITNNNFTHNFFGWGNETINEQVDGDQTKSFYRVRKTQFYVNPSYNYWGRNGGKFSIGPQFETVKINRTDDRLIDQKVALGEENYHQQNYGGFAARYHFKNFNDAAYPTLGLDFKLNYLFRANLDQLKENHQAIEAFMNLIFPIDRQERFSFSSAYYTKFMIGNDYHFYQAANLGANNLLRGYQQNRFVGEKAFATSQDLRWKITQLPGGFVPMSFGVFAGFDLGRVWQENEHSDKWHNSYGGGLWLSALESLSMQVGVFQGAEKPMINFGFGFNF